MVQRKRNYHGNIVGIPVEVPLGRLVSLPEDNCCVLLQQKLQMQVSCLSYQQNLKKKIIWLLWRHAFYGNAVVIPAEVPQETLVK